MNSLADTYTGGASPRRLRYGIGLLGSGTVLAVLAIVIATTPIGGDPAGYSARQIAGILGGIGAPAILGGIVLILPAAPQLRVAAAIGASLTVLGVAMFWYAYPEHWAGYGNNLTGYVMTVYFIGMLLLAGCLFAGIAAVQKQQRTPSTDTTSPKSRTSSVNLLGSIVGTVTPSSKTSASDKAVRKSSSQQPTTGGDRLGADADTTEQTESPDEAAFRSAEELASSDGGTISTDITDVMTPEQSQYIDTVDTGDKRDGEMPGYISDPEDVDTDVGANVPSGQSGTATETTIIDGESSSDRTADGTTGTGSRSQQSQQPNQSGTGETTAASTGSESERESTIDTATDGNEGLSRDALFEGDVDEDKRPDLTDRYCGNCASFTYGESGIQPYCAYHDERLDTMEPCQDWESNN